MIAPGEPGQRPEVRIRYRGPRNEAPVFRVFRTGDGAAAARAALPRRRATRGPSGTAGCARAGRAGGRLRVHGPGARPRRQPHRGPGADPERAQRATGNRACRCGAFTLAGPLDVMPGRRGGAPARSAPSTAPSTSSCRASGRRGRSCAASGSAGRCGCGCRAGRARASTSCASGPGDRRAVWPLAVAGPAADDGLGGPPAAARGAPGAHLAGPQRGGRRPRRLRGHAARGAARCRSSASSRAAPCRRASAPRARRCCASSTGRGSTTT